MAAKQPGGHKPSVQQDDEWEILPPEGGGAEPKVEPLFRWIALFMDNLIRVPGTNFRIGIDPLLGLIPGVGDTSSAVVSALALIQAARQGMPKIVLARMATNILLNELIGIVPVIGDAFSFWFKSNARNYELVKQHAGGTRTARRGDWVFVIAVLIALGFLVLIGLAVSVWLLQQLFRMLGLL